MFPCACLSQDNHAPRYSGYILEVTAYISYEKELLLGETWNYHVALDANRPVDKTL
jgi:hypothetical protein